jgi:hypothetical protein
VCGRWVCVLGKKRYSRLNNKFVGWSRVVGLPSVRVSVCVNRESE